VYQREMVSERPFVSESVGRLAHWTLCNRPQRDDERAPSSKREEAFSSTYSELPPREIFVESTATTPADACVVMADSVGFLSHSPRMTGNHASAKAKVFTFEGLTPVSTLDDTRQDTPAVLGDAAHNNDNTPASNRDTDDVVTEQACSPLTIDHSSSGEHEAAPSSFIVLDGPSTFKQKIAAWEQQTKTWKAKEVYEVPFDEDPMTLGDTPRSSSSPRNFRTRKMSPKSPLQIATGSLYPTESITEMPADENAPSSEAALETANSKAAAEVIDLCDHEECSVNTETEPQPIELHTLEHVDEYDTSDGTSAFLLENHITIIDEVVDEPACATEDFMTRENDTAFSCDELETEIEPIHEIVHVDFACLDVTIPETIPEEVTLPSPESMEALVSLTREDAEAIVLLDDISSEEARDVENAETTIDTVEESELGIDVLNDMECKKSDEPAPPTENAERQSEDLVDESEILVESDASPLSDAHPVEGNVIIGTTATPETCTSDGDNRHVQADKEAEIPEKGKEPSEAEDVSVIQPIVSPPGDLLPDIGSPTEKSSLPPVSHVEMNEQAAAVTAAVDTTATCASLLDHEEEDEERTGPAVVAAPSDEDKTTDTVKAPPAGDSNKKTFQVGTLGCSDDICNQVSKFLALN
jgi:hypothetical protein